MQRRHLLALAVAGAVLASVAVHARKGDASRAALNRHDIVEAVSPDLPARRARAAPAFKGDVGAARAPTPEDVGDVDSFGRNVTWLGLTSAFIYLADTCPPDGGPDERCQVLAPSPSATVFEFEDVARITLPARSADSLLCHWFSPAINVAYGNATAGRVLGRLRYTPTLTIENPVLDDPSLIDPTTGVPFGGRLLTSMTASESFVVPLESGVSFAERTRDSAVCMAGLISRQSLMTNYGLTQAQANKFFRKPTTIRMNVSGSSQYVTSAQLTLGLRIVGD